MMAPYAIAHLKIGLKLQETGYDFGSSARVNVVLTNSLEPETDAMKQLAFSVPALAHEAQVAVNAKKKARFSVVIGNPPYRNNSDLTLAQVAGRFPRLLETSRVAAQVQTRNIRDDYAWFYGAADAYASDQDGIVCLVTSDSYTRVASYRHFRERILNEHRVLGLLRIGRSAFREVSPRISFAILELIRRNAHPAANRGINITDIRQLTEGVRPSALATPTDPRLVLMSAVADGLAAMPPPLTHEPSEARGWSFLPRDAELVESILSDSLPVFKRGRDRIFGKKWPGIITAFDDLLKAREADQLADRMSSFFEACYSPKTHRQRAVSEWALLHGIKDRWLERLEYIANDLVRRGVVYSPSSIKRAVSGSIPNELRWWPPPAYRHFIYYEPMIKIPRNVNPGKFEGWGSMEQWRDDDAHRMSPKLIFTTSTNPRSGYKAFVVEDEWFVKLHGGTSQQYNFTGLQVGGRSEVLDGEPNNLTGGGLRILGALRSYGLDATSLLHLIAAVYNSSLAEQFLSQETGEELAIRLPSPESRGVCVELVREARRMRGLHQLLYDGRTEDREGLIDVMSGLTRDGGRLVVHARDADAQAIEVELQHRIACGQGVVDELVGSYYAVD